VGEGDGVLRASDQDEADALHLAVAAVQAPLGRARVARKGRHREAVFFGVAAAGVAVREGDGLRVARPAVGGVKRVGAGAENVSSGGTVARGDVVEAEDVPLPGARALSPVGGRVRRAAAGGEGRQPPCEQRVGVEVRERDGGYDELERVTVRWERPALEPHVAPLDDVEVDAPVSHARDRDRGGRVRVAPVGLRGQVAPARRDGDVVGADRRRAQVRALTEQPGREGETRREQPGDAVDAGGEIGYGQPSDPDREGQLGSHESVIRGGIRIKRSRLNQQIDGTVRRYRAEPIEPGRGGRETGSFSVVIVGVRIGRLLSVGQAIGVCIGQEWVGSIQEKF